MNIDNNYIYSHCVNPYPIKLWNPITKSHEMREVPCGRCIHCRATKVNEWKTRIYLQSLYSPYTYFCTFTYDVNMMDNQQKLETCVCVHNHNYKHAFMPSPLLLCKSHMQKFFKRLRKNNPDLKLQYFLVGEYGHKYGAPHHHAIIWCNIPLVKPNEIINDQFHVSKESMLYKAWNMGIVSCECLNDQILQGFESVDRAIGYLTKYVMKGKQSIEDLPTKLQHYQLIKLLKQNENYYEGNDTEVNQVTCEDVQNYWRKYGNYFSCSKRPAITTGYIEDYKAEYKAGKIKLHGVQTKSLLLPSYILKKSKQSICPYVGFSAEKNNQLSNASCEMLGQTITDLFNSVKDHTNLIQDIQEDIFTGNVSAEFIKRQRINNYNFKDLSTGEYYIFSSRKNPVYLRYKYNRHFKNYEYKGITTIEEVQHRLISSFEDLKHKVLRPFYYNRVTSEKNFKLYLKQYFNDDVQQFYEERDKIYNNLEKCNFTRQGKYKLTKNNF